MVSSIGFKINPENSGVIYCNGQKISINYHNFAIGTPIECVAKPNPGYAFSAWSNDVSSNPFNPLKFTTSQFGEIVNANFIIPAEVALPNELFNHLNVLIISVIIPSIVGWSIPFLIGWLRSLRQKKHYVNACRGLIQHLTSIRSIEKTLFRISNVKREIQSIYADGKISDSQYALLTSKISEYLDRIR